MANQSQTSYVASLGRGNESIYQGQGQGHMTKLAAMVLNSKNHKKSSSPEPEASVTGALQNLYKS